MNQTKELKHIGAYGLIVEQDNILLIEKVGGPYDGKLDLPGGTIEFKERPVTTLERELLEETGLKIEKYELLDTDSVTVSWKYQDVNIITHHIGIFYKIKKYINNIKEKIEIDEKNDDSKGAKFYPIQDLSKNQLSAIATMELEKLGYKLK